MDRIKKLWFSDGRISIQTIEGLEYSQPLEAFPTLKDASDEERNRYVLWDNERSIRWENIDEDIHISNFYQPETVNLDNEVNHLLSKFPWLDLHEFARMLDMHKSKLDRFRYGIWIPSESTINKIRSLIKRLGEQMSAAVF